MAEFTETEDSGRLPLMPQFKESAKGRKMHPEKNADSTTEESNNGIVDIPYECPTIPLIDFEKPNEKPWTFILPCSDVLTGPGIIPEIY